MALSIHPLEAAFGARVEGWGEVWHPLALAHPDFGKTALYADAFVYEIEGMPQGEALALRDELIAFATAPDNVYRREWQPGDFVIFDAVGGLHSRESFDVSQVRSMRQLSTLLPIVSD